MVTGADQRWLLAGTFALSLPAMWLVGQIAIFAYGFGVWFIPWLLGAIVGGWLLPQRAFGFVVTEFDGPIIGFAVFAAAQNTLMVWWRLRGRRAQP
ncbi:MAG TPA: hypothetical protein VFG89_08425 [Coriobacteriia bacterium]|nr:hypothetical protein [Coriobacteriia bacterium]